VVEARRDQVCVQFSHSQVLQDEVVFDKLPKEGKPEVPEKKAVLKAVRALQ
jgi:hypothetical protein